MGGTFITRDELEDIEREGKIILQVDEDLFSYESRDSPEDETYFINHSCDSNLWMKDGTTFVARRDIAGGEEITVDYALFESEDYVSSWNCRCGSRSCRHTITGKDYLSSEMQKKYRKHFSPVINKKIETLKKARRSKTLI